MRQSPTTISRKTHICLPPKISLCCGGGTPDCSSTFSLIRVIYCDRRASSEDGYVSMKVYALAIISEGCLPYLQDRCQARSMWYFGQRHAHGISWQFAQAPLCLLMSKDFGLSAQPFSILESVQTHLYFDQHDLVYTKESGRWESRLKGRWSESRWLSAIYSLPFSWKSSVTDLLQACRIHHWWLNEYRQARFWHLRVFWCGLFLSHSQSYWEIYNGLWDTENIYQLDPLQIDWWQRRAVQNSTSDIDHDQH